MARIVLASGSPRRQELLTRIGIRDFTVRVPQVEEWYPQGLTPPEIVSYISREKSQAVPSEEDEIVITADTMVFLDQQRLGKPKDEADALRMLTDLAGRRHTVCTGVTLRQGQRSLTRAQSTDVYFRPAGREELTDAAHCIRCCACVKSCPVGARSFETPFAAALARSFRKPKPNVTLL